MANKRQIVESPIYQGQDERLPYTLETSSWGCTAPGSVVVKLYSVDSTTGALTDVSGTNLTGAASANGTVITAPRVISLTPGTRYRLEVQWVDAGNTFEAYGFIEAEV